MWFLVGTNIFYINLLLFFYEWKMVIIHNIYEFLKSVRKLVTFDCFFSICRVKFLVIAYLFSRSLSYAVTLFYRIVPLAVYKNVIPHCCKIEIFKSINGK